MEKTMIEAFSEYAARHKGEYKHAREINAGASEIYGKPVTMQASDFAHPEIAKERSKNNPLLFERIEGKEKGLYKIL